MRILLVEDSRQLSDWLAKTLRRENYVIDCVYDGEDADHALQTQEYALVILDLSLPKVGGIDILRRLRARGDAVAVLILTANDTVAGRVSGLNTGADDYLAKPFDLSELEARIRAQLRRVGKPVGKTALAETVFGFEDEANPNAIEIYVHRVRKKLDGSDVAITTLRGLGYVLRRKNGS